MADEQDRAERLDDDKFDDMPEQEPPVPLVEADDDADHELEAELGEDEEDPEPDYYGAGVPAEEAAMHIEEG